MKKLKYLLFILPFFFGFNVFAKEVDVTSNCYGTTGYSSMYSGDEVQYQTYSNYNFGTTYQYQLSSFETELRYSLSANTDYVITFNTNNTNDFRNNFRTYNVYDLNNNSNNLVTGFTYVSMKKVQISFKTTTATNKVKIQMGGSNVTENITGETNWNIKNAILTIPDTAPSGSTNQDIINNQTNNTNSIINNNNQNTSDIINNNNQNSQNIMDNQNSNSKNEILNESNSNRINIVNQCSNAYSFSLSSGYSINGSNSLVSNENSFYTSDYVAIHNNVRYLTIRDSTENNVSGNFIIVYNSSKSVLDYWYANNRTITLPSGSSYFRISSTKPNINVYDGTSGCISKTESAINDVNNSINNSNVDNGTGESFFDDFTSQDFGLSQIITIPLSTIQSLTSKTCTPLSIPIPFTGKNISLPCMTEIYQTKLPTIYNLWKIVSFGIVAYFIAIDIFHIVKGFKDPESDKVEVLDL